MGQAPAELIRFDHQCNIIIIKIIIIISSLIVSTRHVFLVLPLFFFSLFSPPHFSLSLAFRILPPMLPHFQFLPFFFLSRGLFPAVQLVLKPLSH